MMEKFTLEELKATASYLDIYFFPLWIFFYSSKEEASFFAEALDRVIYQLERFFEGREFMFSAKDVHAAAACVRACLEKLFQGEPVSRNDKGDYEMLSKAANFLESLYKAMSR